MACKGSAVRIRYAPPKRGKREKVRICGLFLWFEREVGMVGVRNVGKPFDALGRFE